MTIMIPDRVSKNVAYIDRFLTIDGCTAGSPLWTDRHQSCARDISRKTGCRGAKKLLSVLMGQPNGAQCPVTRRFNQLSNNCENLRQRSSRED